ncbi:MAG: hypothetical protein CM15mV22_1740 [Eurybiavirus sp.]|nr:MAG: hypothetical protein CM15mV22_1740 [Eurybiavirus sp.]
MRKLDTVNIKNIDASNIVAGTIDPERLANKRDCKLIQFFYVGIHHGVCFKTIRPTTKGAKVIWGDLNKILN